ncbi:MAG: aspartate/glutamate racemase family protein [Sphaerochaetaceae bacterium]|nr:aspartate/glutamate racemase family protein [Sphaerochaetaceae bacterium]
MKHIIAIHTVKSVYETFPEELKSALSVDVLLDNIVDEVLANDPARRGGSFSKTQKKRLLSLMMSAEQAEPDLIVITCSTLSPYIDSIREFISVPVMAIDDAMCYEAVHSGSRICVLATAQSALAPAVNKIEHLADRDNLTVSVDGFCDPEAIAALKAGDRERHDRLLLTLSEQGKGYDVIVLAQASMAQMRVAVEKSTCVRTLSSPETCIAAVKKSLEG